MEYWTAFVLGFVGSLHCAGMCGPLALALPATGHSVGSFLLGRAAYNVGRIITYCLLGAVFGLVGHSLWFAGLQRWASIGLGVALLAGLLTSRQFALWQPLTRGVARLKSSMAGLLQQRSVLSLGALGLLNGLLPCGLVYVACAASVTTHSLVDGAQYMAAFGIGTVPMLLSISLSGKLVPASLRLQLLKAIPVSVFLLATLLILRGMSLGIPFVSPDLSGTDTACCHK
jgi:sulfite exporter TauE/SafE